MLITASIVSQQPRFRKGPDPGKFHLYFHIVYLSSQLISNSRLLGKERFNFSLVPLTLT
jgi:hypothetical protein